MIPILLTAAVDLGSVCLCWLKNFGIPFPWRTRHNFCVQAFIPFVPSWLFIPFGFLFEIVSYLSFFFQLCVYVSSDDRSAGRS